MSRIMQSVARWEGWWGRRSTAGLATLVAVPVTLMVVGWGIFLPGAGDLSRTQGVQREDAVITDMVWTGKTQRCGYKFASGDEYRITWRSTNPPVGQPAKVVTAGHCAREDRDIGGRGVLVRTPDRVVVDPPASWGEVTRTTLLVGGIMLACLWPLLAGSLAWTRRHNRRR